MESVGEEIKEIIQRDLTRLHAHARSSPRALAAGFLLCASCVHPCTLSFQALFLFISECRALAGISRDAHTHTHTLASTAHMVLPERVRDSITLKLDGAERERWGGGHGEGGRCGCRGRSEGIEWMRELGRGRAKRRRG